MMQRVAVNSSSYKEIEAMPGNGRLETPCEIEYVHGQLIDTSRGTRWGEIISVSDLELYEI